MNTLVVSDLHLGNGGSYDIFAGETELPRLWAKFKNEKLHVILNGDTFDFLMNDEPLELAAPRADAQARALVAHPGTRNVLRGLGDIVRGGGKVTFRSGNHDLEIGLKSVQAIVLEAMGTQSGVVFSTGEEPLVVSTAAGAVLVAHGEREDDWNRFVHADVRPENSSFRYPPGSKLVKTILNRLKKERGLRFADLLKPDFSGAVLAALAVQPSAVSELGKSTAGKLVYQLVKRKLVDPDAFSEQAAEESLGTVSAIEAAGLTDEEQVALEAYTDDVSQPEGFWGEDILKRALHKVGTAALKGYAAAHRLIAGDGSASCFSLSPDADEWKAARTLGDTHGARYVIAGHTHAARWARDATFGYLNTGTWIHLMRLPAPTASTGEWAAFLELLKRDPGLSGEAKSLLERRFTCAFVDAASGLSLRSWNGEELVLLEPVTMKR
jgi:UDP-2,3-diacylglucosamine pyrophosphatase LpxH